MVGSNCRTPDAHTHPPSTSTKHAFMCLHGPCITIFGVFYSIWLHVARHTSLLQLMVRTGNAQRSKLQDLYQRSLKDHFTCDATYHQCEHC